MSFDFEAFKEAEWDLSGIGPEITDTKTLAGLEHRLLRDGRPANYCNGEELTWFRSLKAVSLEFQGRLRKQNGVQLSELRAAAESYRADRYQKRVSRKAWADSRGGDRHARKSSQFMWQLSPESAWVLEIYDDIMRSIVPLFEASVREGRVLILSRTLNIWELRTPRSWIGRRISARKVDEIRAVFGADLPKNNYRDAGGGPGHSDRVKRENRAIAALEKIFETDPDTHVYRSSDDLRDDIEKISGKLSDRGWQRVWKAAAPDAAKRGGRKKNEDTSDT